MENELIKDLREGLNHLYDLDFLRKSPLVAHLKLASGQRTDMDLQRTLEQAILALKPEKNELLKSPRRRAYELLFNRYIQQFSQKEVADQLGVSTRHYRREQELAIQFLAQQMFQQALSRMEKLAVASAPTDPSQADLAWLAQPSAEISIPSEKVVQDVFSLVEVLASRRDVQCISQLSSGLPVLKAHPVALRQILLNLMSAAIYHLGGGSLRLKASLQGSQVEFHLDATGQISQTASTESTECLKMAIYLADLVGGKLEASETRLALNYYLTMPVQERITVLVVEDSLDNINLLERYASETRYFLASTRDPQQCLAMAESLGARIIVIDVMMPPIDGWEVLSRLKNHPATAHIPVIVCTILPHKELAFTLGANEFLQKPVTREQFLSALDRLA